MVLNNNFYSISYINSESNAVKATLEINAGHDIFKGHFPSQPIVPGACLLQIIKEITEMAVDKKLQLANAAEIKFLQMINPIENSTLQLLLNHGVRDGGAINVSANLLKGVSVCFKFRGVFGEVQDGEIKQAATAK